MLDEPWLDYLPVETMGRLTMAAVAGAIIGWEREHRAKPAGLRTHMLVSLGAAIFILITLDFAERAPIHSDNSVDPIRTIAGIIGGVGFLGAGSIIQSRGSVQGITTAASIWVAAAMGTAAGMGMYQTTIICAFLSLIILAALGSLEKREPEHPPA